MRDPSGFQFPRFTHQGYSLNPGVHDTDVHVHACTSNRHGNTYSEYYEPGCRFIFNTASLPPRSDSNSRVKLGLEFGLFCRIRRSFWLADLARAT